MAYGKLVSNRISNGRVVVAAATDHGPRVGPTLDGVLGCAAGESAALIARMGSALAASTEMLDASELAYQRELGDDAAVMAARDAAEAEARAVLAEARALVLGFVGVEARRPLGLDVGAPVAATQFADYARNAADALKRADLQIAIAGGAATVSTAALGERIAVQERALRGALDALAREARENQASKLARDAAVEAWERTYRGVANALSGLLTLAGEDRMAERVRPSDRRARGEDVVPESETTDGDGVEAGGASPPPVPEVAPA